MRSIRCVGKDVALLIVKEVKHQSTRASLARVSKVFHWAVRETIEYFLKNGGIASFGINNVIIRPINPLHYYVDVEVKINRNIIIIKKMSDSYIGDNFARHKINELNVSICYKFNWYGRYSTGTYGFCLRDIRFINDKPIINYTIGEFEITVSIIILPEK